MAAKLLPPGTLTYYKQPLRMVRGQMQFLWDAEGRQFLDMIGGIVTVSVGHCHPKVNARLKEQMDLLWHTTSIYRTEPCLAYAEALTNKLPPHLNTCFFVNSGSEANDLVLALARLHTGRFDVLALRNSYHGNTQAILGITNLGSWKQPFPSGFGALKLKCPDANGPWGICRCRDGSPAAVPPPNRKQCNCSMEGEDKCCQALDAHLEELHNCLDYDFPKSTGPAAFIAESIQGVGGTVQYPRQYLRTAFEAIRARGGLTISDEVQTGFGRLGTHFWGFETHQARPDMVVLAKGIANGFPMGALVTSREIAASLTKALYFNTYGGNPLACTVAKTVLEVIEEEQLQQNAHEVGTFLLKELSKIDSPLVGDVRGKGLMIGVELVDPSSATRDRKQQQQQLGADRVACIFEAIKDNGVLVGKGGLHGNVIRIKPPMCVSKRDAEQCVEAISAALKNENQG